MGYETALDDAVREAPLFYGSYALVVTLAAAIVLIFGVPQLLPLLVFMYRIATDRGRPRASRRMGG